MNDMINIQELYQFNEIKVIIVDKHFLYNTKKENDYCLWKNKCDINKENYILFMENNITNIQRNVNGIGLHKWKREDLILILYT